MIRTREPIICRLCLKSVSKIKRKCISIFEKHNDCLISESITSIANIKIQENDGLPSNICRNCLLELDAAINFKNKCESSNTLLNTTLVYSKKPIESENTRNNNLNIEVKKEEPELVDYLEVDYLADDDHAIDDLCSENNEVCDEKSKVLHEIEIKSELEGELTANLIQENSSSIERKSRAIDLKLVCNECGGSFKSKCKLRVHWKKIHLPESLVCPMCKRSFKSFKAFNRHKKVKSKSCLASKTISVEGIGRSRKFHCKKCSYSSIRIKDIITHSVTHSGERPFACNLCHKGFGQQSALDGHKEAAHKLYKVETTCQYCGKQLKGRRLIYKHMKIHSNEVYQCDICKKALKSKASLISHIVRHTGIKSYTCERCANSYYTMADLCNHRRMVHEKGKYVYKCDKCNYTTFRTETIKKHKARHTDTNVPCLVCGIFVENSEKLKVHNKRHFGEKKYPCPYCEKKYMHRKGLSQHVREIHKCTFLQNRPMKQEVKPIKQEQLESPTPSFKTYGNIIEVEVSPLSVS